MLPLFVTIPLLLGLPRALQDAPRVVSERSRAADWVELRRGSLPLVLSAPHGGSERPREVADRDSGVRVSDSGTREFALAVADALERACGERPFVVTTRLHRIKVDLNRELGEGAASDALAVEAWREYHAALEQATAAARALRGGRALLLDLHGHAHDEPLVELGFALSAAQLALDDRELARETWWGSEPVDVEWIRGPRSLGARLAESGLDCVPSPQRRDPAGKPYFNGGYTVRRHRDATLRAVQLELPELVRRASVRDDHARQLAGALLHVLGDWYPAPPK